MVPEDTPPDTSPDTSLDFADLERQLAQRQRPEPPTELRRRVIAAMGRELTAPQPHAPQPRPWWEFAAAAAVVALVLSNLSISAAQTTDYKLRGYGLRGYGQTQPVDVIAEQIRELLPELSQRQALRHAILWHSAGRLAPAPWPQAQELDDELRTTLD
jgi:hypothetical protein